MTDFLEHTKVLCRIMNKLAKIPEGTWRMIVLFGFVSCFMAVSFGIWWGSHQRKQLKENQINMLLNQDTMKAGIIERENVALSDSLKNILK